MNETVTLFRPVGPLEFERIQASGYRAFPPRARVRMPGQPYFYPMVNMNYAVQIARDWNGHACRADSGAGYVTRFRVRTDFILKYPVQTVGDTIHQELWIPAEELPALIRHAVSRLEIASLHMHRLCIPSF